MTSGRGFVSAGLIAGEGDRVVRLFRCVAGRLEEDELRARRVSELRISLLRPLEWQVT